MGKSEHESHVRFQATHEQRRGRKIRPRSDPSVDELPRRAVSTQPSRERVAANVRRLREKRELTQGKLGELAGLHRTYIVSIEKAERNVSIDNIDRLAAALEVDAQELLAPSA